MNIEHAFSSVGIHDFAAIPADMLPLLSGKKIPADIKSAIVSVFPYYTGAYPERNISLYAVGTDYHHVVGNMLKALCSELLKLFPDARFMPYVDSSPIDEVLAAGRAGLGDVGDNGLLITESWGQLVFIGCVLTTVEADKLKLPQKQSPALCLHCGACTSACPTGALAHDGFSRLKCRSELTQKKSPISDSEAEQIALGGFVWGCDICLLSCPYNKSPAITYIDAFKSNLLPRLTPESIVSESNRAYYWRGKELLLRNIELTTRL